MKNFASWLAAANDMMEVDISSEPVILTIRPPTVDDINLFKRCLAQR